MKAQLNELSIFSLRELARRTGVSSPTSKKKQQLIEEIIAINNGIKEPYVPKTKQGRPPKSFGYDVGEIFNATEQLPRFSKMASLGQEEEEFEYVSVYEVMGVVEPTVNDSGFLWVNDLEVYNCYFIPSSIMKGYHLHGGDMVNATISCAESNVIVKNILKVNGMDYDKIEENRTSYYSIKHSTDKVKIDFAKGPYDDLNLNRGEVTYVYGDDNNQNTNYVINLLNSCEADEKLYINVSIAEKNKHILKDIKNTELFVSKITDKPEITKRVVNLAISRATRLFEEGQQVVVVIDDILSVSNIEGQDLSMIKKLISLAKNSRNGSISIVGIMDSYKVVCQVEKLADNKIRL